MTFFVVLIDSVSFGAAVSVIENMFGCLENLLANKLLFI